MKLKKGWITALAVSTFLLTVLHHTFGPAVTYTALILVVLITLSWGMIKKRQNTSFFVQSPYQKG